MDLGFRGLARFPVAVISLSGAGSRLAEVLSFDFHDFHDASCMTAALEGGLEPDFDDSSHECFADEVGGQAEDVGVIVLA